MNKETAEKLLEVGDEITADVIQRLMGVAERRIVEYVKLGQVVAQLKKDLAAGRGSGAVGAGIFGAGLKMLGLSEAAPQRPQAVKATNDLIASFVEVIYRVAEVDEVDSEKGEA